MLYSRHNLTCTLLLNERVWLGIGQESKLPLVLPQAYIPVSHICKQGCTALRSLGQVSQGRQYMLGAAPRYMHPCVAYFRMAKLSRNLVMVS